MRHLGSFGARVALALLLLVPALSLGAFKPPAPPTRWATDTAGFLAPTTVRGLDARLQAYQQRTGRHVILWVGQSTGGVPIEEWAVRTYEAWGVGNQRDEGVAIFVFAADRTLRIEVGYGLEGELPDVLASRIIRQEAAPRLAAGQPDAAVQATVGAVLGTLGGEDPESAARTVVPAAPRQQVHQPPSLAQKIAYGVLGLIVLIFFLTNPRLAMQLLFVMLSRGGGGGGGGAGGGGYSGGGGRSGGGGASGSW